MFKFVLVTTVSIATIAAAPAPSSQTASAAAQLGAAAPQQTNDGGTTIPTGPSVEDKKICKQLAEADGVLFCSPEYNRGVPGVLKNAIDVGSRPYGQSVFDKKPAAIVTASPGSIGGFGANHQIRQAAVFLNMPVMQAPEAYLGHVTDDSFDADGRLREGPLKGLIEGLAHAFHDWVEMIHRSRQLLAEDAAHAAQLAAKEREHA